MTKEETVKIMAMLGAFYAGGKNDPKMQANAWHLILAKYDYRIASKAVMTFAENDRREYATFPAVGCIVQAIKDEQTKEEKPIKEITHNLFYGMDYINLSDEARNLISEERYNEWLKMNAEEFASNHTELTETLKENNRKLLGGV